MTCLGTHLVPGAPLTPADYLISPNGQYSAVLRHTGDFVLYWGRWPDQLLGVMWTSGIDSGTAKNVKDTTGLTAELTSSGQIVLARDGKPYWTTKSKTPGTGPYFATLQDDGNLVQRVGTPDAPGATYDSTGTDKCTIWVHNSGVYTAEADLNNGGGGTGSLLAGKKATLTRQPDRTGIVTFWMVPHPSGSPFATKDLGARRAQRYQFTGSAFNPGVDAVSGHGSF